MCRQAVWPLKYVNKIYQLFANCKQSNWITTNLLNSLSRKYVVQQTIGANVSFCKKNLDQY